MGGGDGNEDGGPAFPTEPNTQPGIYAHHGMSLRDWFAGQALAGLSKFFVQEKYEMSLDEVAEAAYFMADAMLARRP